MIKNIKDFFKMTILGGFFIILPIILFTFFIIWIGTFLIELFLPVSNFYYHLFNFNMYFCHLLSIASFLAICFILGIIVKTQLGIYIYYWFDKVLSKIPGYGIISDTLNQLFRDKKSFRKVVLIDRLNNSILETGFVTDEFLLNGQQYYSVFIPTGPNPTSGFIISIQEKSVIKTSSKIDKAMKSVISCGSGTNDIWGDENV